MAFDLRISTGSSIPIFRQIIDQVRLGVATGRLREGDCLPSVRALAEQLVVNPNTVAKAYGELARDGTIATHQGKGVFISARRSVYTLAERQRRLEPAVQNLVREAIALGFDLDEVQKLMYTQFRKMAGKGES